MQTLIRTNGAFVAALLAAVLAATGALAYRAANRTQEMVTVLDASTLDWKAAAQVARELENADGVVAVEIDAAQRAAIVWHRSSTSLTRDSAALGGMRVLRTTTAESFTRMTGKRPSPTNRRSCCGT